MPVPGLLQSWVPPFMSVASATLLWTIFLTFELRVFVISGTIAQVTALALATGHKRSAKQNRLLGQASSHPYFAPSVASFLYSCVAQALQRCGCGLLRKSAAVNLGVIAHPAQMHFVHTGLLQAVHCPPACSCLGMPERCDNVNPELLLCVVLPC